ncbi:MAG TPA: glycosyltransferase [Burkholderiales bacterium]|jgi:glycosyltransferase involved in cell wall biosynthesis
MKVLFVASSLDDGAAEQVILVSKELVRLGHQAGIYCLSRRAEHLAELAASGVEVTVDDKRGPIDFGVLWRLRRHLRTWRPNLVHSFGFDADVYSRLAGLGAGAPVLNSERTDDQRVSRVQHFGYRLTSLLCDGVFANTRVGAEYARRLHRLGEDRVDVLWNIVDLRAIDARVARSPQPAREVFPGPGLKRLCMVVSLRPVNDHPLALRVLKRLVDEDRSWRLICIGEEPPRCRGYKAQLLAECDRLGVEPFVKFVGHRSDVVELIASSELMLLTSKHGGFPLVALEAMACNTPVVSTDWGDVRPLLPVAEQVVASRDEAAIAAAVRDCHQRRAEIVAAQRRWAEERGTAAAAAATLLAAYIKYLPLSLRRELAAHS